MSKSSAIAGVSPIRTFALNLLEHGYFHYAATSKLDIQLAFLHIDQSIELLVKAKLIELGKEIFEQESRTLDLKASLRSLSKAIDTAQYPIAALHVLHEQRNAIQHFGLQVDSGQRDYYLRDIAYSFLKRFLPDHFGIDIRTILSPLVIQSLEGTSSAPEQRSAQLLASALRMVEIAPDSAIVNCKTALTVALSETQRSGTGSITPAEEKVVLQLLKKLKILSKKDIAFLGELNTATSDVLKDGKPFEVATAKRYVFGISSLVERIRKQDAQDAVLQALSTNRHITRKVGQLNWRPTETTLLTREEVTRILEYAKNTSQRDYVFLACAANTALRLSEVGHLRKEHLNGDTLTIFPRKQKVLKPKVIPIIHEVAVLLGEWAKDKNGWLFPGRAKACPGKLESGEPYCLGRHFALRSIQGMWRDTLRHLGLSEKGRGIHSLRHYAIRQFLSANKDLRAAREFAGHSSSSITEKYEVSVDSAKQLSSVPPTL
jgi:integrase